MIKLGVIGYGGRMNGLVRHVFRDLEPELRVVGIVDPDEAGVRERLDDCDKTDASFYETVDDLVRQAKPDALAIGTRCNLHTPYAIEASRYDIPLYLEKPVAISMDQAVALEKAFENSRCPVVVSFPLRVSPLCVLARRYVEEGAVGDPVHIAATNYVPYGTCYWEAGYRNFEVTQGLFLQKATHDLDYMTFLMGKPVVRVAAMQTRHHVFGGTKAAGLTCAQCDERTTCLESPESRRRNGTSGSKGDHYCLYSVDCGSPETGTNEDCSSALVEFAGGAHGVYTQVFYARGSAGTRGATVSGYEGMVQFDWYTNQLRRVRHHAAFAATETATEGASHFGGDTELAYDFFNMIKGAGRSRTPVETGVQSAYMCLAAKESAETGAFVNVRQVGQ